jgi:hypothetical protein
MPGSIDKFQKSMQELRRLISSRILAPALLVCQFDCFDCRIQWLFEFGPLSFFLSQQAGATRMEESARRGRQTCLTALRAPAYHRAK